jgi:FKBP-type peptidyl-prolyl cis-trans isomerase FkpA
VLQKFWPILLLIAIGVVALVLIGLDTSSGGGKGGSEDWEGGETVTRPSGLQYQEVQVGDGQEAKSGDHVHVLYTGRLTDTKKVFDSSEKHGGKPHNFDLGAGGVIKGWDEGIAGMKVGGKRILKIPANLGYGARGAGADIPPNADLEFKVELVKIGK